MEPVRRRRAPAAREAGEGLQAPIPHQLLDVPPLESERNPMDSVNPKGKCGAEAAPRPGAGRLDVEEVRERLRTKRGPEFWRSLDELAATPEFEDLLHVEFPRHASEWMDGEWTDGVSRRRFLQ